jgi:hypothetical protein
MTERTYTVTMTAEQRFGTLYALSFAANMLTAGGNAVLQPLHDVMAQLKAAPGTDAQPPLPPATPTTPTLSDRWARNKNGVETPNPEGCETIECDIAKLEDKPSNGKPRKIVTWSMPGERGFAHAACWDEKLFPYLANRLKQRTTLHLLHNGDYTNVVGVRA